MTATAPELEVVVVARDTDTAIPLPEDPLSREAEESDEGRRVSLLVRLRAYGPWIALVVFLVWAAVRAERWVAPPTRTGATGGA